MEIKCIPKEGRRGVFVIEVDGDPWREIHSAIFGKSPKFAPFDSFDAFETYFLNQELKGARNCAIRRLSIKSLPSSELDKILKERFVTQTTREKIIQEFCNLGYIKDNEWIEGFIQQQVGKKVGPKVIAQKLRAKGISEEASSSIIEEFSSSETHHSQIQYLLQTKYRSRDLSDYKEKQKVIASLIRKGFDYIIINSVLGEENL